ncbi:MAG: hypothetical protein PHQ75_13515, partial [Thermoguttaceae bacterium]|nr:hypothetical protein [Thermoguttaceae bacterium]
MPHTKRLFLLCLAMVLCLPVALFALDTEDFVPYDVVGDAQLFPFEIVKDLPNNITNVRTWEAPAGTSSASHGIVHAENGNFVNDSGACYLFGTNLCFTTCFPEKEKAQAQAAALARFGINVVRLHHMDNSAIWGKYA